MKLEIHSQLNGNILTVDEDGCLMEEYCAGGARYNNPQPVDWDNLNQEQFDYCVSKHMFLLAEQLPHLYDDYYPTF